MFGRSHARLALIGGDGYGFLTVPAPLRTPLLDVLSGTRSPPEIKYKMCHQLVFRKMLDMIHDCIISMPAFKVRQETAQKTSMGTLLHF